MLQLATKHDDPGLKLGWGERIGFGMASCGRAIKCRKCGDIIESTSVHDFKYCTCGAYTVDGGMEYLRRIGEREDWEELSELEERTTKGLSSK